MGNVLITTDEYKPYHPNAIEIARKYPTEYVEIVEQDAGPWTGSIMKKAIDDRHNFIFEGTLKNDRILDTKWIFSYSKSFSSSSIREFAYSS